LKGVTPGRPPEWRSSMARLVARIWRDQGHNCGEIILTRIAWWPHFTWDAQKIAGILSTVRLHQGARLGKMTSYGLSSRWHATLKVLTEETIKSSAIEGVVLDPEGVRSSIARRLNLKVADRPPQGNLPLAHCAETPSPLPIDSAGRQNLGEGHRPYRKSPGIMLTRNLSIRNSWARISILVAGC